ncbi:MAG TPA: hypothetical protein VGF61_03565 [Candidatus Acidoferrum sp.]
MEFFDRSTMGMVPLRCETWRQFIFVNFDQQAPALSEFLGNIPQQASEFQFEGLALAERRDYIVNCNWKCTSTIISIPTTSRWFIPGL